MKNKKALREKRHKRIRKVLSGTASTPRLAVFRSSKHIYVQAIDDVSSKTISSASTKDKEIAKELNGNSGNINAASLVGKAIAERLKEKSIVNVKYDRGGFLYHGRVKALADSARENGLNF